MDKHIEALRAPGSLADRVIRRMRARGTFERGSCPGHDRTTRPRAAPWVLLGVAVMGLSGCDGSPTDADAFEAMPAPIEALPRALSAGEVLAIDASTAFGLNLLRELAGNDPLADHFLSPLSASMALGMVLNAATGGTYDSLLRTLGVESAALDDVNHAYRDLVDLLLPLDPRVSTSLVNLVIHDDRPGSVPSADFQLRVREFFDAEIRGGDFRDAAFATELNRWVRDRTGGKIRNAVPEPIGGGEGPDAVHLFVNALHFEGDWRHRFDASRTYSGEFVTDEGRTASVRYMVGGEMNRYWMDSQGGQVVELPYGGDAFAMTILLPSPGEPMSAFLHRLDEDHWNRVQQGLRAGGVFAGEVHLPKWRMEWDRNLLPALVKGFGLQAEGAFPGLNPTHDEGAMALSDVTQRTTLRVDERGTEATAVTVARMRAISTQVERASIRVDRPFVFAIRERHSGVVLFLGVIRNPPQD
jgi:serpin B